ncbi:hypothetical protein AMTRI_Chr06g171000 [Amborella trichopoda]|uniref:Protein COFACTOR ASSEMBLY OF COMPLEX C SUBUNIT B CCB1, chloroplastic n=1 Tax=Amborella trichopoda TaxID=13333 RepID=W1PGA4_AMBTC|nr:protein COFACTOR ASSEMBLY OF COMPLEX C SUBUNIT B CCB1, chloroplastic [Amborella trichopoda]XP_011623392.1 protein COFACTOR ASSEMBLY OF COMPLEX C SUBUNIT B CCB1, chloroplastic [Amborella trichopoda]ERN06125.1 hypothetical protein AMTR_s00016p00074040 [Amborella trichopoda]|eukprot:XP_006844450.1 protein COFACTOR ASSEMBLY OF COMPLEX C SUBUNIT B CCB1, chloroplastic [Amborella trichopoda]
MAALLSLSSSTTIISLSSSPTLSLLPNWPRPTLNRRLNLQKREKKRQRLITASFSPDPLMPSFLLHENVGYSQASYYTSLGLFVISVPGLWSLIKRSVKSKIVQKTFVGSEKEEGKKAPSQIAGEILSFFTRNNFIVSDRGEAITFEGMMVPSRGQAALLTFCTCISLASVALVLTITIPEGGNRWFWLTALSPLAGAYYWKRASRKEQIKVKMILAEDGSLSEIIVQGDDEQVEQMRKELNLMEKGMVYVKGIFER